MPSKCSFGSQTMRNIICEKDQMVFTHGVGIDAPTSLAVGIKQFWLNISFGDNCA